MGTIPSADAIAHALIGSVQDEADIHILVGGKFQKNYPREWRKWRLMAACALNICGYCPDATRKALEIETELPPSNPENVPSLALRRRALAAQDRLIRRGFDVSMV